MTNSHARRSRIHPPHLWGLVGKRLQDVVVRFKVFASIIVAEKKKLMLAAVINAKCGGIFGKIPYNTPKCCSIGRPSTLRGIET